MAFRHGKDTTVYVNGLVMSSYLNSIEMPQTADVAETSTFGNSSKTYIPGMKDAQLNFEGLYDDTASVGSDEVFESLLGQDVIFTWYAGQDDTVGNTGKTFIGNEMNYSTNSTISDAVKIVGSCQGSNDINAGEHAVSLHELSEETTTANGDIVDDNGAASANGASAVVQATAVTGTVSLIIEHSSSATFAADVATLMSFTDISAIGAEKVECAGTVKQYIRAVWTLDGGEALTFNVAFTRR